MIEKFKIKVPKEVRFLSELKNEDSSKFELPNGILHKGLTGAGATHLALTDSFPVIICSPRIKLMENKKAQLGERIMIVKGGVTDDEISDYLSRMDAEGKAPKLFCTYDSFKRLKDFLGEKVEQFRAVIDEFHCLLNDSGFKSDIELKFIREVSQLPYVTYLSATPIPTRYLEQIPELSKPYYEMEWEEKPSIHIKRIQCPYPVNVVKKVVQCYKAGSFPVCYDEEGTEYLSREAVIYVNSVTDIVNIVDSVNLTPEEVNIIVSDNEENKSVVNKLGNKFHIGTIPLKDEPCKMFTLCTSTAYFGVDMYSDNASTFVVSDVSRSFKAVNIATELIQIAGRQRNENNPFRHIIHLYYNTSMNDVETPEEFRQYMSEMEEKTAIECEALNSTTGMIREKNIMKWKRMQEVLNYSTSYTMYDDDIQAFTFNRLKWLSDMMRWETQNQDYSSSGILDERLADAGLILEGDSRTFIYSSPPVNAITNTYFAEQMKWYCYLRSLDVAGARASADHMNREIPELEIYYEELGPSMIASLGYKRYKLKEEYEYRVNMEALSNAVHEEFKDGGVMPAQEIKSKLRKILAQHNIEKKKGINTGMLEQFGYTVSKTTVRVSGGITHLMRVSK